VGGNVLSVETTGGDEDGRVGRVRIGEDSGVGGGESGWIDSSNDGSELRTNKRDEGLESAVDRRRKE